MKRKNQRLFILIRGLLHKILSYDQELSMMKEKIARLEKELGYDDSFGILNRNGLLRHCRRQARGQERWILFIDIDDMHGMNAQLGYEETNHRIRSMFDISRRESDLIGRFFSGDEILCVSGTRKKDARALLNRLRKKAAGLGISFTSAIGKWQTDEDISRTAHRLSEEVMREKEQTRIIRKREPRSHSSVSS